jgi:hypothetical protein
LAYNNYSTHLSCFRLIPKWSGVFPSLFAILMSKW